MQFGSLLNFTATALNDLNKAVSPTFTYASSNSSVVDISPTGIACAGTWNSYRTSVDRPACTELSYATEWIVHTL